MFYLVWVLVLLSFFSCVLLVVSCIILFFVVRYRFRRRKYERIGGGKYVPGKTAVYFKGKHASSSFVPMTYPTTLQCGTSIVYPAFQLKKKPTTFQRNAMYQSPSQAKTIKYEPQFNELNRSSSLDDRMFRKVFPLKPGSETKLNKESSLVDFTRKKEQEKAGIFISENTNSVEQQQYDGETSRNSRVNTPENVLENQETDTFFYAHSDFFPEEDRNASPLPTAGPQQQKQPEDQQIISYDQDSSPKLSRHKNLSYLSFTLEYKPDVPKLIITVLNAFDLQPLSDSNGEVNCYVNLCLVPEDFLWQRTKVIEKDCDPMFSETFEIRDVLYHKLREYTLCFYVMDSHRVLGDRVIGKVLYPLSELRAEQVVDVCKELSPP